MVHTDLNTVYPEVPALAVLMGYQTANAGCCKVRGLQARRSEGPAPHDKGFEPQDGVALKPMGGPTYNTMYGTMAAGIYVTRVYGTGSCRYRLRLMS